MSSPAHARRQFSIRGLMLVTAAIGVLTLVASRVGWIEASGVAVAMLLLVGAYSLPKRPWIWVGRSALAMLASVVLWMVAVDVSESVYWCPQCQLHWSEVQIRLFRVPLYEHQSYFGAPEISQIAEDLGQSCPHRGLQHQLRRRFWGLVIPHPNINGIIGIVHEPWYTDELRARMKALGKRDPVLAQEFHDEVMVKKNWAYWRSFVRKFWTENDPKY